jgi:hypothetical protein
MDNQSILDGYVLQAKFAEDNGVSKRTIARYRSMPDGLPHLRWGGYIYIPIERAREWLRSQVKHPNQRRKAA